MAALQNLDNLNQLAADKSSESRRALMRHLSDMFFETPKDAPAGVLTRFESLFSDLAEKAELGARVELSERFASAENAPKGLLMKLARDAIEVAGPILTQSSQLSEQDLIDIIEQNGQDHMRAIARRQTVPERVSDAIVERGDDQTVSDLVQNEGAKISRSAFENVTQRAETNATLQSSMVHRKDAPTDLLADLMLVVSNSLREIISDRFEGLDNSVVEAALAASQRRMKSRLKDEADFAEAEKFIRKQKLRRQLGPSLLVELLRERKTTHFCVGFSELTGVDFASVKRALNHQSHEPLALLCKANGLEKALFVTIVVLRSKSGGRELHEAREIGRAYDLLSKEEAERTLRFMQVRAKVG